MSATERGGIGGAYVPEGGGDGGESSNGEDAVEEGGGDGEIPGDSSRI